MTVHDPTSHDRKRYLEEVEEGLGAAKVDIIEFAMMIKTQALDLYLRMASESVNPIAQEVLFRISSMAGGSSR